jgi:hypothetical protein
LYIGLGDNKVHVRKKLIILMALLKTKHKKIQP